MRKKELIHIRHCPFCNGKSNHVKTKIVDKVEEQIFFVHCNTCHANGPVMPTRIESIEQWNARSIFT